MQNRNQVILNIGAESSQVFGAGKEVHSIAQEFLKHNPHSPRSTSTDDKKEKLRLAVVDTMPTILKLIDVFNPDSTSPAPATVQWEAFREFVSAINILAKAPGMFSKELQEKQVLIRLGDIMGNILYGRPQIGGQIVEHLDAHVSLMKQIRLPESPEPQQRSQQGLRN